jgi:hypothetical protein
LDKATEELVIEATQKAMGKSAGEVYFKAVEGIYRPKHGDGWFVRFLEDIRPKEKHG